MTGQYQETHGVRTKNQKLSDNAYTLAEAFSAAGYECLGFSQIPFTAPLFGLDQGFARFETFFLEDEDLEDGRMAEAVCSALKGPGARPPRMVYAHFRRPHAPYDPPQEWRDAFVDPGYKGPITGLPEELMDHNKGIRRMNEQDLTHLQNLYQAGIRAVDHEVGQLLEGIDKSRTLVILLSDHGEAFGQHGYVGHNFTAFEEMVQIVFILAHPTLKPGRVLTEPVMSIDLFHTLADLFDLEIPFERTQGMSLYPALLGGSLESRPYICTSSKWFENAPHNQMFALFDGRMKYVRGPGRDREALYDLLEDPLESKNLKELKTTDFQRLKKHWKDWKRAQGAAEVDTVEKVPRAMLEKLRGLGYFGGTKK
jgi:arylsulfatase A-like enzyme